MEKTTNKRKERGEKMLQNVRAIVISLIGAGIITCITGADGRYEKACLFMLAFICIKELLEE